MWGAYGPSEAHTKQGGQLGDLWTKVPQSVWVTGPLGPWAPGSTGPHSSDEHARASNGKVGMPQVLALLARDCICLLVIVFACLCLLLLATVSALAPAPAPAQGAQWAQVPM